MARIDLRQLDDFSPTLLEDIANGQSIRWDSVNNEFVIYTPYAALSFQDQQFTPTSTSSTTFVLHQNWTTPVLPAGTYSLSWNLIWYTTNVNSEIEVLVERGTTNLAPVNFRDSTRNSTARQYANYVTSIMLATPQSLNLKISIRRIGANNAVVMEASEFNLFTSGEL
jgi:hypothetical protein